MSTVLEDLIPYGHEGGDKIFFIRECDLHSSWTEPFLCLCFKFYEQTEYFIQIYQKCEKACFIDPIPDQPETRQEYHDLLQEKLSPRALEHVLRRFNNELDVLDNQKDPWKYKPTPCVNPESEVKRRYPVTTLCGSTRFKEEFMAEQKRLTLEGHIVISVGLFGHSGDEEVWTEGTKEMLDDMHKRKIDMADGIFVINKEGYIGESTRSEIEYARAHGKRIDYLEKPDSDLLP